MKHLTLTLKSSDLQDTGQFEGYASTFGNVDQGGDLIEPGAFRESVAKARAEGWGIPMLWQHDQREAFVKGDFAAAATAATAA